jgi:DsbC/DsbD-like thiol-disulfide interchange protein
MNHPGKFVGGGWLLVAMLMLCGAPPTCAAVSDPHLTVELRTRESGLAPNRDATVGVYFKLEPGWHIYWQNPGDSGEPPTVAWRLPPGITAGAMRFPAPEQMRLGSLMDFGYDGDVLFSALLHADGSLKAGGRETIAADVHWLVCREVCIPGHQVISIDLPMAASATPIAANAGLFAEAQERLPRALPAGARASAVSVKDRFLIRLRLGHPVSSAVFFPLDANQIDNAAAQQVQALPDGVQVAVKKDENLRGLPAQIRGLVELGGGRAYDVTAPVVPAVDDKPAGSPR